MALELAGSRYPEMELRRSKIAAVYGRRFGPTPILSDNTGRPRPQGVSVRARQARAQE